MIQLNLEMPKTCKDCPLTYIDDDTYSVEGVRCCVLKRCCTDIIDKDKTCPLIKIDVLDKIRYEILEYIDDLDIAYEICGVFDKYKAESEVRNADIT